MGLRYVEVDSIDETEAAYTATVDLRLRWQDLRLQYPPESAPQGFLEFRDEAAAAKIAEIWTPVVSLQNLSGEPSQQMRALRIFPDGRVEMMVRTTATFETPFEVERFPFDRQRLQVEVVSRRESVERLSLEFEQEDLDFSQPPDSNELRDWVPGVVSLKRDVVNGWYGEYLSRVTVSLAMQRRAGGSAALIFVPLLASLSIPLLAIWLNRMEEGEFQIEAFEQANVIVGGLFAVIALNFTLNAEYGMLGSTDNTVRRLFTLNYLALGAKSAHQSDIVPVQFADALVWTLRAGAALLLLVLGGTLAGPGHRSRFPVDCHGLNAGSQARACNKGKASRRCRMYRRVSQGESLKKIDEIL